MKTNRELRVLADAVISHLEAIDYLPHLIGGLLRVEQLGGVTNDVDIAILVEPSDFENVKQDMATKLPHFELKHECDSPYAHTAGFFADYRWGDVNIIIYNESIYPSVRSLVASFDLNINKYYVAHDKVFNDHFDGTTVLYNQHPLHLPRPARIDRFKAEYPHLDWSQVHA